MFAGSFSIPLFAQKSSILTGKIVMADGTPGDVTVSLKRQKRSTQTDARGHFRLVKIEPLPDTLLISAAESHLQSIAVTVLAGETKDLGAIKVETNVTRLQDIEVRGRMTQSFKSDYSFLGTKTQTASIDIPQSISSITKELISDKMDFTLKDAASTAAGVNDYSGYDEYTIRGFKAENARLINGLRGYNSTYTSAMLVNIERIEVVKGPSATLFGNCDPGGTINLVTKKPLPVPEGEATVGGGNWRHFRFTGDITGPLNTGKTLLYRFNAGYDNTHSFRDNLYAKSFELAPSLSYIPNERIQMNADFSLSHVNTLLDRGQPGLQNYRDPLSTPIKLTVNQPGDYLYEDDYAATVSFSYKINEHLSFNSGYLNYVTSQQVTEHGVQSYLTPDSVNLYYSTWNYHTLTNTLTNYFTIHFNTGKFTHQFLVGYDYIKSKVDLDQEYFEDRSNFPKGSGIAGTFSLIHPRYITTPVNQYSLSAYGSDATDVDPTIYHTQGVYWQDQIALKKWKLLLGLREEFYRADIRQKDSSREDVVNVFLPRLGIVYALQSNLSVYATFNKGFDPFEASTSTQVFEGAFKPINSELLETGGKANFCHNKLFASVSLYQLTLQNVAVNANELANPNLFVQQGEDRSTGVETEVNGNILPNLSIAAAYAYCVARVIRSKIPTDQGMLVENAPKNESSSWIKYSFKTGVLKGLGLAVGHSEASSRNTLDKGFALPGYVILNGGVRYFRSKFSVAVNLNNMTNTTYWVGAYNNVSKWPGAPRNMMFTAGYTF